MGYSTRVSGSHIGRNQGRVRENVQTATKRRSIHSNRAKITDFVSINGNSESPCSDRGWPQNYDREDNWEHLCSFWFVVNSSGVQSTTGSALQYYYFNAPRLDDATPFAGEFVARAKSDIGQVDFWTNNNLVGIRMQLREFDQDQTKDYERDEYYPYQFNLQHSLDGIAFTSVYRIKRSRAPSTAVKQSNPA